MPWAGILGGFLGITTAGWLANTPCRRNLRSAVAADHRHYPPARHRPGLPAAQAPGRRHEAELSFGTAHLFYPEATDAAVLRGAPARRRPGRAGPRRFRRGQPVRAGRLRERPAVRGVVVPVRRAGQAARHRDERPQQGAAGAGRASPSRWRSACRCCPAAAGESLLRRLFEPLGYAVTARVAPAGRQFPTLGRQRLPDRDAGGHRAAGRGTSGARLRAAPGAGRRQALLGRARRGQQAAPARRPVAGRAPGAGADRAPLPPPRPAADQGRAGPRWSPTRAATRTGPTPSRTPPSRPPSTGSACTSSGSRRSPRPSRPAAPGACWTWAAGRGS